MALIYRYDCLKAAMDILKDGNIGYIQMVRQIGETYEKADRESNGFRYDFVKEVKELDRLINNMPQEAWLQ